LGLENHIKLGKVDNLHFPFLHANKPEVLSNSGASIKLETGFVD